ncbi:MAG: septum site-determining protein MinC [Proteobacteria bacterium]|nr:septum site-determining protein MinC [Pseudomonadota bacterium]
MSQTDSRPSLRVRGRSFMALVLAPEPPLADWLAALDAQIARAPGFFDQRPVLLDLGLLPPDQPGVAGLIEAIAGRGIRIIGTEGAHKSWAGVEKWGIGLGPPGAAAAGGARAGRPIELPDEPRPAERPAPAADPAPIVGGSGTTLLIDHAVRSGQSIVHEAGDVTVLGTVAWGAEIVAGGSIHIYGTLRGRAIAGLNGNKSARIFCRRLEAELLAIDGVYRTAEDMDPAVTGRPAQAWLDGETMLLAALD